MRNLPPERENVNYGRRLLCIKVGIGLLSIMADGCSAAIKDVVKEDGDGDEKPKLSQALADAEWKEKRADDYFEAAKREIVDYEEIGKTRKQIDAGLTAYKKDHADELKNVLSLAYLRFGVVFGPCKRKKENLEAAAKLYRELIDFYAAFQSHKYEQKIKDLIKRRDETGALINEITNNLIDVDYTPVPPFDEVKAIEAIN